MNSWCDIGATWRVPKSWRKPDPIFAYLPKTGPNASVAIGRLESESRIDSCWKD
jgi:hypothetical protein